LPPTLTAKEGKPRPLARFFAWFNRISEAATEIYLRLSGAMIRKSVLALMLLAACGFAGLFFGRLLPSSFLPMRPGLCFHQHATSECSFAERTAAASRDVEKILSATLRFSTTPASLFQPAKQRPDQLQRFLFRHAEALERP